MMTTSTKSRLQPCPKCGSKYRTIKVGVTQNKIKKQKWFCYACRRQFLTEMNHHPSARTMNSSGITAEQEMMKEDE